jgi:hypothetical protein
MTIGRASGVQGGFGRLFHLGCWGCRSRSWMSHRAAARSGDDRARCRNGCNSRLPWLVRPRSWVVSWRVSVRGSSRAARTAADRRTAVRPRRRRWSEKELAQLQSEGTAYRQLEANLERDRLKHALPKPLTARQRQRVHRSSAGGFSVGTKKRSVSYQGTSANLKERG